jgi:hypothetical protein
MEPSERIEHLKAYCSKWKETAESVAAQRDELLELQRSGIKIFDHGSEHNFLPTMINEADEAARTLYKIFLQMESLRDHAIAGEVI